MAKERVSRMAWVSSLRWVAYILLLTEVLHQAFGNITLHIGPGDSFTDHCLSRAVNETLTAQCNTDFVNYCNENSDYADLEPCVEMG